MSTKSTAIFNFFANDKGGVGKTPSAINLAAYAVSIQSPTLVVDADIRATNIKSSFSDALVIPISEVEVVEGTSKLGELIRLGREGGKTLFVDTGANVRPILQNFFEMVDFQELARREGWKVNVFAPIDHTRESRVFAASMQKHWPWADHWHVHMRKRQAYDRSKFPEHPENRVIVFPFIPDGMREELQYHGLTLDQAITKQLFNEFLQQELLVAARNMLYRQLETRRNDFLFV